MKVITKTIYNIDELSESAKEKAYSNWQNISEYPWGNDNMATLTAFEKIFPVEISGWEYGYYKYIKFNMTCENEIENLSGVRLMKYIYNNYYNRITNGKCFGKVDNKYQYKQRLSNIIVDTCCALTGYCIDDYILNPIFDFLKSPSENITFRDLMEDCLESWLCACHADYEHYFSMENFIEECELNHYEFYNDGEIARRV